MKKSNVFLGLVLVLGALLMLLNSFGLHVGLGGFRLWVGIILIAAFVKSVVSINVEGICFSAAFFIAIFAEELGFQHVSWIQLMLVALFMSIGINLICGDKLRKVRMERRERNAGSYGQVVDNKDYDHIEVGVRCGSVVKYIDSDNFVQGNLSSSFGELVVYFDNAIIQNASANVHVEVSFGNIKMYIPRTWRIENNITSSFAGVDERGRSQWTEGGKILYLDGSVNFGSVEIYYI